MVMVMVVVWVRGGWVRMWNWVLISALGVVSLMALFGIIFSAICVGGMRAICVRRVRAINVRSVRALYRVIN